MKGGTRIALGVGVGYVLGRTRKMRFALALVGASMAKRSSDVPGALLERGVSLLKSSPGLTQLTDSVRGDLAGAVRSAAVTAASNGIDTLNARLQQGSTLVSEGGRDQSADTDSDEDEDVRENVPDADEESTDEDVETRDDSATDHDESDRKDAERPGARSGRPGTTRTRKASSRTSVRRSGSADRKPASSTRRRSRSDADEAPVRRTGR